jgi:hypothetical protein
MLFLFLQHFALASLMHCTILPSAHSCAFTIDHAEPGLDEPIEQAQAEDLTNLALDQGKPGVMTPCNDTGYD